MGQLDVRDEDAHGGAQAPARLVAEGVRGIGGRIMGENPDHDREQVPGRPAVSPENLREQAEEGRGDWGTRMRMFVRRLFGRR